ncbi:hypothetical protein G7092_21805 [Mucilaginibacter sp. HC2]|uniref:hypothetical protein n=1 Tax=Mucilaginibacter inviolabilis TaxID=2714892 RepID=UPI00140A60AF|nr:hypothetical protein [Mucilaginibacter inviolabilis]NHA06459.1 hypothetical protein [Mucilaginibacter inviolabilis]
MSKSKRDNNLQRIKVFKDRFEKLSTEKIINRLTHIGLTHEAAIAYKQVLEERGIDDYLSEGFGSEE